jgi:hypothetical protein
LNLAISSRDQAEMEPVVLAFEVPYFSGTVVDVGQSVTTQGVTIELEKLVISRWGTGLYYILTRKWTSEAAMRYQV